MKNLQISVHRKQEIRHCHSWHLFCYLLILVTNQKTVIKNPILWMRLLLQLQWNA